MRTRVGGERRAQARDRARCRSSSRPSRRCADVRAHADAAACAPMSGDDGAAARRPGGGRNRLGGSVLAQVFADGRRGRPTWTTRARCAASSRARAGAACATGCVLAYHDRSDGGLFVDRWRRWPSPATAAWTSTPRRALGGDAVAALFNEELGAVLQVRAADSSARRSRCCGGTACARMRTAGQPTRDADVRVRARRHGAARRGALDAAARRGRATSYADAEAARQPDAAPSRSTTASSTPRDPGLSPVLTFDPDRGRGGAVHRKRRAAAGGDPARAGRQQPGGDGRGVHPRRLRRGGRAHERILAGPRVAEGLRRAGGLRRLLATATCWARAEAGPSPSSSTRGPATSSRASSRARTASPSASATAAR